MLHYIKLSILILFIYVFPVNAAPVLEINDYDQSVDFSRMKTVLVTNADSSEYNQTNFDDGAWSVISLPFYWNRIFPNYSGVCWFRIHLKFPDQPPQKSIGVSLGTICNVDETYFNGTLIGKTGEFSPRSYAYDRVRIYEIPSSLIKPGNGNVLSIRVGGLSYKRNGLTKGEYLFAPYNHLLKKFFFNDIFNLIFIVLFIAMIFYFLLFYIKKPMDKEKLVLSAFTLCVVTYLSFQTQIKYMIVDNFLLLKRIEYCCLILGPGVGLLHLTLFFKKKLLWCHYIFYAVTAAAIVIILYANDPKVWQNTFIYLAIPSYLIIVLYVLYLLITEFKKDFNTKFMLAAYSVLLACLLNDTMLYLHLYQFVQLTKFGFLILFLSSAIVLSDNTRQLKKILSDISVDFKNPVRHYFDKKKLAHIMTYIEENYADDISRESIAKTFDLNPDYLGKMFKMVTGRNISDYINEFRIIKASELLLETDENIINIAFSVGFGSMPTFYRIFKKVTGETATDYRSRQLRKIV